MTGKKNMSCLAARVFRYVRQVKSFKDLQTMYSSKNSQGLQALVKSSQVLQRSPNNVVQF